MKTVHLDRMEDVSLLINELSYREDINRYRSTFMYRGLPDSRFNLATSIQRNCGANWFELENSILRDFYKYAVQENPFLKNSQWEQMIIGQHHGLPTRLLDWSYSPLMALHFATVERDLRQMDQHDCILWKIDIEELNSFLPKKYQQKLREENSLVFTVEMLSDIVKNVQEYDRDMGSQSFVTLEPPSIDSRIVNQYSYFSVIPREVGDIEQILQEKSENSVKYILDKSIRWNVREMLDRNNINERITHPGLEGVSHWLKRHYYNNKNNESL